MSEGRSDNEDKIEEATVHVGEVLRNAREKKSITIAEVSSRLNLEEHVVEALEDNNYESLPELAYVRGYLLAYIRLMDLPTSTLKSFDEENQVSRPLLSTRHSVESSCSQDGWVKCISTGLIVLLVIVSVLWVLEQSFNVLDKTEIVAETQTQQENNKTEDNDQAETVEVFSMENELNQPVDVVEDVQGTVDEAVDDLSAEQSATSPSPESEVQLGLELTNAADTDTLEPDIQAEEVQEAPQVDQIPVLTMKFSGMSWIRIDDGEGNKLKAGTYNKGEDINLSHEGPLHLIIGRTNNVELDYAGEPVDLSSFKSGKVARLVLGKSAE